MLPCKNQSLPCRVLRISLIRSCLDLKVLLLEARDRIGGRSWSSNIGDYPFEMGGTWVHWAQPQVWREICRYNMRSELEVSPDYTSGCNTFSLFTTAGGQHAHELTHHEEDALLISSIGKFFDVDGRQGQTLMPRSHDEFHNKAVLAQTNAYNM